MIWIIGSNGMLGKDLCLLLEEKGLNYISSDMETDITNIKDLQNFSDGKNIDWIVNCAAYTAVDKAEENEELCYRINSFGPENIAKIAAALNAKVIHISTDYVFDGRSELPYREKDNVNPLSVYGKSKLEGEELLIKNCRHHIILRTAWLYGGNGPNFITTMLKLMKSMGEIGVIADQWGSPTWTKDLSKCIVSIINTSSLKYDIYHASAEGKTNWYEFANTIQNYAVKSGILEKKITINSLTTDQYVVKAVRPKYSLLSKEKLKKDYNFEFPDWNYSVKKFITEISNLQNIRK